MVAHDKVTHLSTTLLERLGHRIDQAWQRICKGDAEWIEGSLELAQALAEGRERFSANKAFGDWLIADRHDHVSHQDRAALINLAGDLTVARDVLTKTTRRSYRLIWEEEQDRFTNVGKTDKPKRGRKGEGRPKGQRQTRRRTAPAPADAQKMAEDVLDKGKTLEEVTSDFGLPSVQHGKLAVAKEEGRREMLNQLLDAAAAANFSEKGKLKIEDAVRIHKARLDKQFDQRVNAEVRRRIDAADDATRANNKKLHLENINLQRIVGQRGVFTERQFKQMLMLCHPDSSAGPQLKAELLQVLIENKIRLIKPERVG